MQQASTSSSSFPSPAHRGQLTSLARHLTSDADAEDYVHDAYVAALSLRAAPRAEGAWLRQVVRNSVREKGRRRRRWEELERLVPEATPEATPERHLERTELSDAIRSALDELDPKYRDVLRHRFFLDASSGEIAKSMGCPAGTVRWRLHEGLRRLKTALDERFGDRAHWYGAAFALRVPSTAPVLSPPPTHPGVQPSMFTPALLKVALSMLAIGGVTTVVAQGRSQDDPPPTSEVAVRSAQNSGNHSQPEDLDTLRRQRATAVSAEAVARRKGASRPGAVDIPDAEACGREEVAAFNANDEDPNADEHLIDAARCYEEAGVLGRVVLLHVHLRRRFPESPNASASRDKLLELYPRLLDPNEATRSPLARACTAPIREGEQDVSAEEYIAAADCVRAGGLIGVELSLRQAAQASSGDIDDVDNDAEIERLEQMKAHSLEAIKKLKSPRGDAIAQGKARSPAVQAAVECGRLHRPKDSAPAPADPDASAIALAGCLADKGLLGKALIVHELLLRDDDARHLPAARKAMRALIPRILDVNEPKDNPLGVVCIAPVEAAGKTATAAQYLTAADCLSEGSMVGAQIEYLGRALVLPGDHDRGLVRTDLENARARRADFKKKAKRYAAGR